MNLAAIVAEYTSLWFTKAQAVRFVTGDRLRSDRARGKGNAALRRQRAIEAKALTTFTFKDEPLTSRDLARMEAYYAARRPSRCVATIIVEEF